MAGYSMTIGREVTSSGRTSGSGKLTNTNDMADSCTTGDRPAGGRAIRGGAAGGRTSDGRSSGGNEKTSSATADSASAAWQEEIMAEVRKEVVAKV